MKQETSSVNLIDPEKEIFKQNARMFAIEKAMGVNSGYGAPKLIEDAEKIYQWLIKDL